MGTNKAASRHFRLPTGYAVYLEGHTVILPVAPTGGVHGKDADPNLREQPDEIAEQVAACEDLGAAIVHLHARDEHRENDADAWKSGGLDLRDPRNWALSSAELDAQ